MLARLVRDRPSELRADLQQYYGLNMDGMGAAYSYAHAACLCAQLPAGARVWHGTAAEWDTRTYLLAKIEHTLRVIAWQSTEDAQKRRNYPKPIDTPASREEFERKYNATQANRAFVDEILNRPQGGE